MRFKLTEKYHFVLAMAFLLLWSGLHLLISFKIIRYDLADKTSFAVAFFAPLVSSILGLFSWQQFKKGLQSKFIKAALIIHGFIILMALYFWWQLFSFFDSFKGTSFG